MFDTKIVQISTQKCQVCGISQTMVKHAAKFAPLCENVEITAEHQGLSQTDGAARGTTGRAGDCTRHYRSSRGRYAALPVD